MIIGLVGDSTEVERAFAVNGFSVLSFRNLVLDEVVKAFGHKPALFSGADRDERRDELALSLVKDNRFRSWLGPDITANVPVYCKSNTLHELFCLWYDFNCEVRPGYWRQLLLKEVGGVPGNCVITGLCGADEVDAIRSMGASIWFAPDLTASEPGEMTHDTDEFVRLFTDADVTLLSHGEDLLEEIGVRVGYRQENASLKMD